MIEKLEAYEVALREKEKEVHGLRVRIKELVSVVSDLKKELTAIKVQSDFGYNLVNENPDAGHIKDE
tara:strand:+ start:282 stop:482 length:201 start_codon:yes stop_codon:yes gene_type:complete